MPIVGWIAKMLLARGVSQKTSGIMAWAISLLGGALIVWLGWSVLKHSIISRHDTEQRAAQAERQLERVGTADRVDESLEKRDAARDQGVKGAIDDAVRKDPRHGTGPVGPVSNAAVDELRRSRSGQRQHPSP